MAEHPEPLDELQFRLLRRMRDATAAGLMTWIKSDTDGDLYHTTSGPIQAYIQFKWPVYAEGPSDRDFVEISPAGRFMIGTPGWILGLEILAAAFNDWRGHVESLRRGYDSNIHRLDEAIERSAE